MEPNLDVLISCEIESDFRIFSVVLFVWWHQLIFNREKNKIRNPLHVMFCYGWTLSDGLWVRLSENIYL